VRATAAFEASDEWTTSGAQSAAAWLAVEARLPKREARRTIRLGKALRQLPVAEEAFSAGEISAAHVEALDKHRTAQTDVALRRDEAELVDQAKSLRFESFTRVLEYWRYHADPGGAEERADAQRDDRSAFLAESFEGMWFGKLTFDPIAGGIVDNELRRLTEALFEADWGEARARLGRDPVVGELARTPAQRRADAFVEMATRSASMPKGARRPAPLVSFLVGFDHRYALCELAQGTVVTPGSLFRYLTVAEFERIVFTPPNRVDVSGQDRFFKGPTRRGIEVTNRICQHAYCDRPAVECQVDHIVPFSAGGPTTADNGQLLCEFHNRLAYQNWLKQQNQRPPPDAA
jgi:hypothetical protein